LFFLVCDGLKGLPDVVANVRLLTTVQTCIIHLIRNTFRHTSRRDHDAVKRDIRPVYTAVNAEAARAAMDQGTETWGQRYPAVIRLWENAWEEFIPFLDYDLEIRTALCSTNAIESLNARYRRAVKARGHFPSEQAALQVPLPGHPFPGPYRHRTDKMGHTVEAGPERLRCYLRRPVPGRRDLLTMTAGNTVHGTDPRSPLRASALGAKLTHRALSRHEARSEGTDLEAKLARAYGG
jgi:hypothetical protein